MRLLPRPGKVGVVVEVVPQLYAVALRQRHDDLEVAVLSVVGEVTDNEAARTRDITRDDLRRGPGQGRVGVVVEVVLQVQAARGVAMGDDDLEVAVVGVTLIALGQAARTSNIAGHDPRRHPRGIRVGVVVEEVLQVRTAAGIANRNDDLEVCVLPVVVVVALDDAAWPHNVRRDGFRLYPGLAGSELSWKKCHRSAPP